MNYLKLTFDKLEVGEINDLVAHESCGAISLFVGTTRDNFDGKTVSIIDLLGLSINRSLAYLFILNSKILICDGFILGGSTRI